MCWVLHAFIGVGGKREGYTASLLEGFAMSVVFSSTVVDVESSGGAFGPREFVRSAFVVLGELKLLLLLSGVEGLMVGFFAGVNLLPSSSVWVYAVVTAVNVALAMCVARLYAFRSDLAARAFGSTWFVWWVGVMTIGGMLSVEVFLFCLG